MVSKSQIWKVLMVSMCVLGCSKADKAPDADADAQCSEVCDVDAAPLSQDASSVADLSKDCSPSQEN